MTCNPILLAACLSVYLPHPTSSSCSENQNPIPFHALAISLVESSHCGPSSTSSAPR
uniref:Uncharacterized protein n=1 Tax=Physcomitrium patens TaxID=3218 RepID=A0A2K1JLD1_PHYPA|nr:hypothetical protein PHYPA_017183 [Physcomitrium patens]